MCFNLYNDICGVVLEINCENYNKNEFLVNYAGWIIVLLNLKSIVYFGNDLRNHIPDKS